jgi:hypothetical protein
MLSTGEVNPLAVWGVRRLYHCPPHFVVIKLSPNTQSKEKLMSDWIWVNFTGRFYLGPGWDLLSENEGSPNVTQLTFAGFEIPGEAMLFSLVAPDLIKNTN